MAVEAPPGEIQWAFWNELLEFVQKVNAAYRQHPFGVTSWWRSAQHNAAVGGDPYSQHLLGLAIDAYPRGTSIDALERELRNVGLYTVRYHGHVHAQLRRAGYLRRLLGA